MGPADEFPGGLTAQTEHGKVGRGRCPILPVGMRAGQIKGQPRPQQAPQIPIREATTMSAPNLKTIFAEALGHLPGSGREAYLDEACRGDAALRAEVEALLRDHERLGGFLASAHESARPE